jgi:hypothetical protein
MNPMNREDILYEVFNDIPFPFHAVDMGRLSKALLKGEGAAKSSKIEVILPESKNEREIIVACLRGFIGGLHVSGAFIKALADAHPIKKAGKSGVLLRLSDRRRQPSFKELGRRLVWEETGIWPIAYSTIIDQFLNVLNVQRLLIEAKLKNDASSFEAKGFARENAKIISEYPRHLPTRMHYAAASIGAWLGGAVNIQYLSLYATIRQIYHSELNFKYLERIGFDESEKLALDKSGFVAVPASLLTPLMEAQGGGNVFGSISIDEQNLANLPAIPFIQPAGENINKIMPGLVVDKYYRAPFWARRLGSHGIYGADNVLRDHYDDFYKSISPTGLIRCKHYCAPIIEVSSVDELRRHVSNIPVRHVSGVLFRGQRRLYELSRDSVVKKYLFSDSCSFEPSLITSASRNIKYEYDSVHFALKNFVERKIYSGDKHKVSQRLELWRKWSAGAECRLDFAIMALAQHYGVPSHGLDVTASDDVAIWFATNAYEVELSTGLAKYSKMQPSDWPDNPENWPVVLVCQTVTHSTQGSLHDCVELGDFGFEAKRPSLQQARFFLGGHNDHQNRLAETVVCAFRLKPGSYSTNVSFENLFPHPDEDPAYRLMLQFADEHESSWGRFVNRFHSVSK